MGPGLSHKTIIIDYYLKNYTFTEIERITNHSERSINRYLADFTQIITLYNQGFQKNQIRLITQKSDRLVREYLELFKTYSKQNNDRLLSILNPQKTDETSKKKQIPEQVQGGR